ncbi:MAG: oxidoreductase [Rhodospirillaceae bacterium]|nr:MAG: oxidoreductase [Rhodospirillaceae bacterium]
MTLVSREGVLDDPWVCVADDAALPDAGAVIVSLERWQQDRQALLAWQGRLGIRLASDQPPEVIVEDLARFDLVALEFPRFGDGRAYSYARILRERYGFTGELRAVGEVLRDQLFFMLRCGFDRFEVPDQAKAEAWMDAFEEISVVYQPGADGRPWVPALRR